MVISVVKVILPILIAFGCGMLCRRIRLFDDVGCQTLKSIVGKIMLPVILVNAFMFADYSLSTLVIIIMLFAAPAAVFFLGYIVRKGIPQRAKYMPFIFSTMECGTIGYPLISMLFGQQGMGDMALIDVGHTAFLFMIVVPLLQAADGQNPDPKDIMRKAFLSPVFLAMVIGITLGVTGAGRWLAASETYEVYSSVVNFITAPAGTMILIALGYDISFDKQLIKPVLYTSILRLATMELFCAVSVFVISRFYPMSRHMLYSLIFAFSLPASFAVPMFARFEGHRDYVSATISFSTVLSLAVFIVISVLVAV